MRLLKLLVLIVVVGAIGFGAWYFEPWTLVVNSTATELPPPGTATRRGTFVSQEHKTTGTATVFETADGKRTLYIESLDTSNGPALEVRLSDAAVTSDKAGWSAFDDGKYVTLGSLKGNRGSQSYEIPASADLTKLRSVSIWCERFSVSFGAAALTAP